MEAEAILLLEKGNILCSSRSTPMKAKIVRKVREIYSKCRAILDADHRKDTPLILAARLGLANMVWGFIECAKKQTDNSDLEPFFVGGLESFIGQKNWSGNTALHVAAANGRVDVVKELLFHVSWEQLISCKNAAGQTPLSQIDDKSEYDEIICTLLERARSTEMASTVISIDDEQQESRCYIDEKIEHFQNPVSDEYEKRESLRKLDDLKCEVDSRNNDTILHYVVKMGDMEYAKAVIEKHSSLMYHRNSKGEIPAFIAARAGQLDILRMMINYLKRKQVDEKIESLMTRKKKKQSALHIAIKHHHVGVVFWLIKEVPGLVNLVDEDKISPLYVAAENGYAIFVKLLLDNCKVPNFGEPNVEFGTALHAAANKGSVECIQYLLKANDGLLNERNNFGYTPLDEAVFCGRLLAVKELVNHDRSTVYQIRMLQPKKAWGAYISTNYGGHLAMIQQKTYFNFLDHWDIPIEHRGEGISAIHIAAMNDHNEILEYLISECPGCIDVTDHLGMNILHVVIARCNLEAVEFIFQQNSLTGLINQKDNLGNTPMHLLVDLVKDSNLDMEITKFLTDPRVDNNVINNESKTPIDMADDVYRRTRLLKAVSQARSKWKVNKAYISDEAQYQLKMMDQIVLVAAFIATASFAAAFAIPGGFDSNEGSEKGTPILLKRPAYKAFVVANALAFTCSCCVFFENIKMLMGPYSQNRVIDEDLNRIHGRVFAMHMLTGMAMAAMVIAFVTGTYVVLTPSLGFAISICSICLFLVVSTSLFAAKIGGLVHKIWYRVT